MKSYWCSVALLMIAATGIASAQSADVESGFYVGAYGGVAKYPKHPRILVGHFTLNPTDVDHTDSSWGFTGGYRFGKYFAIEAGYVDLGEGKAKLVDAAGSDLHADATLRARGETLAFAGILPFGSRWEAYAKLGLLRQDVDFRLSGTQAGAPFALSSNADGQMKLYQEIGISYRFDTHWKTSLTLTRFTEVGEEHVTGHVNNMLSPSIGLDYRF